MYKIYLRKIFKCFFYTGLIFIAASTLDVIIFRFIPIPNTLFMKERSSQNDTCIIREWVPIEKISPNMYQAVISSEDNLFMVHNGFDWKAIKKAIAINEKKGTTRFGGSTISQQTAKNVFLWPSRSWVRKGLEVYYTFLIELFWSKERIMEVYLNVVEFGIGLYGVQKASNVYFNKNADKLTVSQAALLAVVLPNPVRLSVARPSSYVRKRQSKVVKLMSQIGPINLSEEELSTKKR